MTEYTLTQFASETSAIIQTVAMSQNQTVVLPWGIIIIPYYALWSGFFCPYYGLKPLSVRTALFTQSKWHTLKQLQCTGIYKTVT